MATRLTKEQKLARIREEEAALLQQIEEEKANQHQTLAEELKANESTIDSLDKAEIVEIGQVKEKYSKKRDKLITRNLEIEDILGAKIDAISNGA